MRWLIACGTNAGLSMKFWEEAVSSYYLHQLEGAGNRIASICRAHTAFLETFHPLMEWPNPQQMKGWGNKRIHCLSSLSHSFIEFQSRWTAAQSGGVQKTAVPDLTNAVVSKMHCGTPTHGCHGEHTLVPGLPGVAILAGVRSHECMVCLLLSHPPMVWCYHDRIPWKNSYNSKGN